MEQRINAMGERYFARDRYADIQAPSFSCSPSITPTMPASLASPARHRKDVHMLSHFAARNRATDEEDADTREQG